MQVYLKLMSELLDNKCDVHNEILKIKFVGFMQALVKCVMKINKPN